MKKYSRWEDAMIAQTQLLEWSESEMGLRYLARFFMDMNEKHTPQARNDPRMLGAIQLETLRSAEPVFVSDDVTELIDVARKTFKPEVLLPGDAFAPRGFMLFPRPILLDDMPPTELNPYRAVAAPDLGHGYIPVRAVSWMPLHAEDLSVGSYWISYYVAMADEFALADELGVPSRFDLGPDERGTSISREEALRTLPLSLVHQWQWSWGEHGPNWDSPDGYDVMPGDTFEQMRERARQQCALIHVAWRIAAQLVRTHERPQRQLWRDALRKGTRFKDVTVITLRRARDPHYGEGDGESHLSVRFIVRGHWRNQPYPSLGENVTRQIWIAPYVKGPDDAPLRVTERAWEFVR